MKQKSSIPLSIALLVLIAIATYSLISLQNDDINKVRTRNTTVSVGSGEYKNGTYLVTGSYTSPAGPETIDVEIALENDIVVSSTVTSLTEHPTSRRYQKVFVDDHAQLVVGKNINEIELDIVSGSSLTSKGYNEALQKVKDEAST